jgi:hypothetical protein
MPQSGSCLIAPLQIDLLKNNLELLPREFNNHFEYKRFDTDRLRQNTISEQEKVISNDKNISISLFENNVLKGYFLIEYLPYDSEIFEFNVYRISDFCFLGMDEFENIAIIKILIDELKKVISDLCIHYLTLSINANLSSSSTFLNLLIKNDFYYINTLMTFKLEKDDYKRINLPQESDDEIIIRYATIQDYEAIVDIANNSHKINRFHLDKNLDKIKCDYLYKKSAENSILKGYADVIFVAEYKNIIVGYYSGKINHSAILEVNIGNAIISAVSEKARKLGVFSLLNKNMLEWFYNNSDISEMGTYINNIPVHKTWTNNGLNIIRCTYQLAFYKK